MAFSKPMLNEIKLLMETNHLRQLESLKNAPESIQETYQTQIKAIQAWHAMIIKELEKISA